MNIRPASTADISAILKLERPCTTAAHWTEQQYRQIFQVPEQSRSRRLVLLAEEADEGQQEARLKESDQTTALLGFLVARHVPPEWELENIVIAPGARRKYLASQLLAEFIIHARGAGAESIFLEVRESNQPARALYKKHGFEQAGSRRAYYSNPVEDAIVYRQALPLEKST